jgi:hypothetical protein
MLFSSVIMKVIDKIHHAISADVTDGISALEYCDAV